MSGLFASIHAHAGQLRIGLLAEGDGRSPRRASLTEALQREEILARMWAALWPVGSSARAVGELDLRRSAGEDAVILRQGQAHAVFPRGGLA